MRTTFNQKHQILESLNALDQTQTEKVMDYINGLITTSREDARYQKLKREAMKEIKQALGKGHKLNLSF
jgi:tellurite resistance protein